MTSSLPDSGGARVVDPNAGACLHDLFSRQVEDTPDAIALVCDDARCTYAALDRWATRCARMLHAQGFSVGTLVGLCGHRSLPVVAGLLGVLKAGGCYVPIDPDYPPDRIRDMLRISGIRVMLTVGRVPATLPLDGVDRILPLDLESLQHEDANAVPLPCVTPDHLAAIIFTSGSQGLPKGVALSHSAIVARIATVGGPGVRYLTAQKASLSVVAHVGDLLMPLARGGPVVMLPDAVVKNIVTLARSVRRHGLTQLLVVPSHLHAILENAEAVRLLDGVRIILSGEGATPALIERFEERLPGCRLLNAYGLSETSGGIASEEIDTTSPTAGRALPGTVLRILDEHLTAVGVGLVGELWVSGRQMAQGYVARPGLTAERFIADPFSPCGGRLYRTGDLARWSADGRIEIIGRADREVKVRGFRVNLGDVEAVLEQHASIARAVVLLEAGGDSSFLRAIIVPAGRDVDPGALHTFLLEALPGPMVPSRFDVVKEFPLLPNGKVDRRALASTHTEMATTDRQATAPERTVTEAAIVDIWCDVLRTRAFGASDDFFVVGGDSLRAMRVLTRVGDECDVDITIDEFFANPTVRGLAELVDRERGKNGGAAATRENGTAAPVRADEAHCGRTGLSEAHGVGDQLLGQRGEVLGGGLEQA